MVRGGGTKEHAARAAETKLAKSYATGYRIDDQVVVNTPKTPRIHGKKGRVVTTNLGEVGVSFSASDAVAAWFLPAELVKA